MTTSTPTPQDIRIEDDDFSQFMYAGLWRTVNDGPAFQFSGGSQHVSYTKGSEFSVSFNGSYVWYLSDTNYDHGRFQVTVDDRVFDPLTGYSDTQENNILLFGSPLDPSKQHTLVVTNLEDEKALTLDCIIYRPVNTVVNHSTTLSSTPSPQQTPIDNSSGSSSSPRTPAGVYIGIAMGSIAFLLLLVLLGFILVEKRRRRQRQHPLPPYMDTVARPVSWTAFPQPSRTPSPIAYPQPAASYATS